MSAPHRRQPARLRPAPLGPSAQPLAPPFAMIKLRSREWHRAWQDLARISGDRDCMAECPLTGEVWQYMGSTRFFGHWEHSFRHRNHPASNGRRLLWIPASPGWTPDEKRPPRRKLH